MNGLSLKKANFYDNLIRCFTHLPYSCGEFALPVGDWRGISLKKELVEEVERFIEEHKEYKSVSEFVQEAIRVRMQEIRKIYASASQEKGE